jgi:hypothetical protein
MAGLTTRMLPLNVTSGGSITGVAGPSPPQSLTGTRYYAASGGQVVDVAGPPDGDAAVLVSQGFCLIAPSGTTALRQSLGGTYFKAGQLFVDTTLGLVILWDGLAWRSVVTGAVA